MQVEFILPELPIDLWALSLPSDNESTDEDAHSEVDRDPDVWSGISDQIDDEGPEDQHAETAEHRPKGRISKESFNRAVDRVLPAWLEMLFSGHQPWILDQRVSGAASQENFSQPKLEILEQPLLDEILETHRLPFGTPQRRKADHSIQHYERVLKTHWGHEGFRRETQAPAAEAIADSSEDVLVPLPTGEGKSVLFQIPALIEGMATSRLSIVISPLRALMKDQVSDLSDVGFALQVDYLSADLDRWSLAEAYRRILDGDTTLLYVAPERFRNPSFRALIRRRFELNGGFGFLILDEAHCFWLWGIDFRPDYFFCVEHLNERYRRSDKRARFLLFSATVTKSVLQNLETRVSCAGSRLLVRPEENRHPVQDFIELGAEAVTDSSGLGDVMSHGARCRHISEAVRSEGLDPGKSLVIVFTQMRQQAEDCSALLGHELEGWTTAAFHAGVPSSERHTIYTQLNTGEIQLLAATKAFGMGMDIRNIHRCFHLSPPCSLEDLLQEVGRTGRGKKERDEAGLEAVRCTVLWSEADLDRNKELVTRSSLNLDTLHRLHDYAVNEGHRTPSDEKVAVLYPRQVLGNPTETIMSNALGWLEREPLKRIEIIQSFSYMLEILVRSGGSTGSESHSGEPSKKGRLWTILEGLLQAEKAASVPTEVFANRRFLGQAISEIESEWTRLVVSMPALFRAANLDSIGEAYEVLGALALEGRVKIDRKLEYRHGRNWALRGAVIRAGQSLVSKIVESCLESKRRLTHPQLHEWAKQALKQAITSSAEAAPVDDLEVDPLPPAIVRAVLRSAKRASIGVDPFLDDERVSCFHFDLPSATIRAKRQRWDKIWTLADSMLNFFQEDQEPAPWEKLLSQDTEPGGWRRFTAALGILQSLGVVHADQDLRAIAYLVKVRSDAPLLSEEGDPADEGVKQVERELRDYNEFNRLRALAMELWLRIPDSSDRRAFVDEYFDAAEPGDLEIILARRIDELQKGDRPSIAFEALLQHVRQETLDEELRKLKEGEEPTQWAVATARRNRDLLVNAGPGAGKTRVLLIRAAHLIHEQGLRPEEILILAFNRAVVSELRRRVGRLFKQMGYGSYTRKLRVHTFHGFAILNMKDAWRKAKAGRIKGSKAEDSLRKVMNDFSERMLGSDGFAKGVAGGFRAILVDEFQDLDDRLFRLILRLKEISKGFLTVIGDDDQDVLRYNREGACAPSSTDYFRRLQEACPGLDELTLEVNFRSSQKIVNESQQRLEQELPAGEVRIKGGRRLRCCKVAPEGRVQEFPTWERGIELALKQPEQFGSSAVLCRTNAEAFRAFMELSEHRGIHVPVRLLGGGDCRLSGLRHIAELLSLLRRKPVLGGEPIDAGWDRLKAEFDKLPIPEGTGDHVLSLDLLRLAFLEQDPRADIATWCDWLDQLDVGDAERILADTNGQDGQSLPGLTISTIHKVKGLEFDSVVVMPSAAPFPLTGSGGNAGHDDGVNLGAHLADEARLSYVALTRSRKEAWIGTGDREAQWRIGQRFEAPQGKPRIPYLCGNLTEMDLNYPALADLNSGEEQLQKLLRRVVKVGDQVQLYAMKSGRLGIQNAAGRKIAQLSKSTSIALADGWREIKDLQVSAIYRWSFDKSEEMREISSDVQKIGWLYTVLVVGA